MKQKTFLYTLVLTFLLGFSATAPVTAQHHRHGLQVSLKQLDLSEAQKAQLKALRTEQREAAHAWMEANSGATREQKQAYREKQREKAMVTLNSVLTPEQQQQLEAMQAQRPEGRRGLSGRRRAHRLHHLAEKLELTEAQLAEIKSLHAAHREATKGWHEANPNATREERQTYRKQQGEAHRAALSAVLTAEQRQTLEAMRAERGGHRGKRDERPEQKSADGAPKESAFELRNYPNPFNPTTEIQFMLAQESHVSLIVYDVQGREVRTLLDAPLQAGTHTASFDASGLPTGTYLYRLTVGNVTETGRMVLVK